MTSMPSAGASNGLIKKASSSTGGSINSGSISGSSPANTKGTSSGSIPTPAAQFLFRVHVEGTPLEFTHQCVAFAMNFVSKELALLVEQSTTNPTREHIVIQNWINNPKRLITLEIIDGQGNVADTVKFTDCEVKDHVCEFNYMASGSVVHVLGIKYDTINLGGNKAQTAFASAMAVVSKP